MRGVLIAAALIAVAGPAAGQTPQLSPQKSADQVQRYIQALNGCNVDAVSSMIDPDVSSIGAAGQFGQSKDLYVRVVSAICATGAKVSLQANVLRQEEFGDLALEVFEMTGTMAAAGKTAPANQRVTMLLRRNPADGAWRILHIQTANAL